MINNEKNEQLSALSAMIEDFIKEYKEAQENPYRIGDEHHILWSGNPSSKIMIVQMHPDNAEINWAKRHNAHDLFVCSGPGGHKFRRSAKRAGFEIKTDISKIIEKTMDEDMFMINLIPFYPLGGSRYSNDTVNKFIWIYESIKEIIEPKIIITLGYDVFNSIAKKVDKAEFWSFCEMAKPNEGSDGILYLALEDPNVVMSETLCKKNKGFSLSLKRLYTKLDYYLGGLQ